MSSNDKTYDAILRHQIFTQRYGKKVGDEYARAILRFRNKALDILHSADTDPLSRDRWMAIALDMAQRYQTIIKESNDKLLQEAVDFGVYEAEYTHKVIDKNISVSFTLPSEQQIYAAVQMSQMQVAKGSFVNVSEMLGGFSVNATNGILRAVSDGFALGQTVDDVAAGISNAIFSNATKEFERHSGYAKTLARTLINNTATIARGEVIKENSDIIDGYQWVATLDKRTTIICGSLDGQIFEWNDKNPKPPAHYNCRSTIIPVINEEFDLGRDIQTQRPAKSASGIEQVNSGTNYETWLKRQPKRFQVEILGKDKADIFRRGNVSLDKFIDERGRPLTLEQLRKLDAQLSL